MKFNIIMPTYNDSGSIEETINSLISQSYKNWRLLISDDGSTDNTREIVKKYLKNSQGGGYDSSKKCSRKSQIEYYYQENQDQLNAIKNVSHLIEENSLVLILHSDDVLDNEKVLQNINDYFEKNNVDAIIADLPTMDDKSIFSGIQKTKKYKKRKYIPALQLLWLGRNLYADTFVAKEKVFREKIVNNYINWNTPFWLLYENKVEMLNVKKVDFFIIRYRVFDGNYINNEIGKLNVINGELRTSINLMKYYNIPFYKLQYIMFRALNKLKINYIPLYLKKETKNKAKILKFIINKRFYDLNNKFLINLIKFYENKNERTITINKISKDNFLYYGKDMRKFNNDLMNNTVSNIYKNIIDEMEKGFTKIIVVDEEDKEKMLIITKFLCINPFIKIEIAL